MAQQINSVDDLPSPGVRWVARRKLEVIQAIQENKVTREEVLVRYSMSEHELQLWEKGLERYGKKGVMVTQIQSRDLR